jgi:hypothetical protein
MKTFLHELLVISEKILDGISVLFTLLYFAIIYYVVFKAAC